MRDSTSLQFCKFKPEEADHIHGILRSIFELTSEEIEAQYAYLNSIFESKPLDLSAPVPRSFFESQDSKFQQTYKASPCIATDLPSLMEYGLHKEKPTVFLVGQDAKNNKETENVHVGTPYGLHHKYAREVLGTTKFYFKMIRVLLNAGYRVYLTDVFKVWVCSPDKPFSGTTLRKVDRDRFSNVLGAEIEALKPEAVITWGKRPKDALNDLGIKSHLNIPHPSGAAGGKWKQILGGQSPTQENKFRYWKSFLSENLLLPISS